MLDLFCASALAEEATETNLGNGGTSQSFWDKIIALFTPTVWICIFAVLTIALMVFLAIRSRKKWDVRMLAYGAICIALATVLRYVKLFEMPQGGSVTLASMFPLMLFAAVYGVGPGMLVGAAYGFIRYMTGGWFVHPVQFLLDYPLAFGLIGLTGIYANISPKKRDGINNGVNRVLNALCRLFVRLFGHAMRDRKARREWVRAYQPEIGADWCIAVCMIIGALGRALSATLAGVFFWDTAFWASVVYNGTYLIPDTLICMVIAIPLADRLMHLMKNGPVRRGHAPAPAPDRAPETIGDNNMQPEQEPEQPAEDKSAEPEAPSDEKSAE